VVSVKTAREIELMRQAGRIAAAALRVAGEAIGEGVTTAEIDEAVHGYILSAGAKPTFLGYRGYPATTNISINDRVIHGIPGETAVRNGDIVSVDVGATFKGYVGDNAETFAVGEISPEARRLMDVTLEALKRGIAAALPGNRVGDISSAVQGYVEQNGFSVVRDFTGHGVGSRLHEDPEVPNFGRAGHGVRLVPGMTIAIEPMATAGGWEIDILDDGWTVVTRDRSLAAHFERTVLITDSGPVILTAE
jgi:methionyl aminopeptidase